VPLAGPILVAIAATATSTAPTPPKPLSNFLLFPFLCLSVLPALFPLGPFYSALISFRSVWAVAEETCPDSKCPKNNLFCV
jgi:hypothetical protein